MQRSGDEYSIVFSAVGAYVRGFDHESPTSLFGLLVDRSPEAFQRFAEDYYEVSIDLGAVSQVHALRPLNQELVSLLTPEVSLTDLAQDISEIGYPQLEQESA